MDKLQFLNLYGMMMADGIMHPNEMAELYRIGTEHFGLTNKFLFSFSIEEGSEKYLSAID